MHLPTPPSPSPPPPPLWLFARAPNMAMDAKNSAKKRGSNDEIDETNAILRSALHTKQKPRQTATVGPTVTRVPAQEMMLPCRHRDGALNTSFSSSSCLGPTYPRSQKSHSKKHKITKASQTTSQRRSAELANLRSLVDGRAKDWERGQGLTSQLPSSFPSMKEQERSSNSVSPTRAMSDSAQTYTCTDV